jgi:hypothetical protein
MEDEGKDRGEKFAGTVVFQVRLVSIVAFACSAVAMVLAMERGGGDFAIAAGVMMLASALGFGLLANAVLRR